MMINELVSIPLEVVALAGAAVGASLTVYRFVIRPVLAWGHKVNSGMDTLLGYPPVLDPGSGRVLKAATPALAQRVEAVEEATLLLAQVLARLEALETWRESLRQSATSPQTAENEQALPGM